jgi:predicted ATPase/DNA-binding SARP family transcriptional activator/Tfp pilus assembly protein PilF
MAVPSQSHTAPHWRIQLLGKLIARSNDHVIDRFPTRMTAELLALLAYPPGRRRTREEIIDILWPDADLDAGRDRLSQALAWLRRRLEPGDSDRGSVITSDRYSITLRPESVSTDVNEFLAATAHETTESLLAAREIYHEHLLAEHGAERDVYKEHLLIDYYSDWILAERRHLHEVYVHTLHRLAEMYRQEGHPEQAVEFATRAVAAEPMQEEAHVYLIRLLLAAGKPAEALRQYREMERILEAELDEAPIESTRKLLAQIRAAQPPEAPAPQQRPPIPVPLTRLFGRESEIEAIRKMVEAGKARLISLLGTGGVGKTRLALAAAARIAESITGLVAFVPLADIESAERVPAAILTALQMPRSAGEPSLDQIAGAFSSTPGLLVLDNAEHLITGLAPMVADLLQRAPRLTVLVTTRQHLGIEGEREVSVSPLALPAGESTREELLQSPTVQLFVDRASAVRPGFAVTEQNAEAIAALCDRLEGLPLAIELCAAWAQTLSPAMMLDKLSRRFDLLVSRRIDITPRHRTLRAALEYSFLQLPAQLRRVYAGLSVFRGGWDLEAATAVCLPPGHQDPLEALTSLTELRERSLIVAEEPTDANGEMRYRMLETLREFASEQMRYAERAEYRGLHAGHYLALDEAADAGIAGPEQERHLRRLDHELENLRAALAWSLEAQEAETGLRIGSALGRYWSIRGYLDEGLDWLRRLLESAGPIGEILPGVRAMALSTQGYLAWLRGDYATARTSHAEALRIRTESGDSGGIADSLYYLGITAYRQEHYSEARELLERSLQIATERSDSAGISRVLLNLGNLAYEAQDFDEAARFLAQSLEIEQRLGNRRRIADALNNLGLVAAARGDYASAADQFRRSLEIKRELLDNYGTAVALTNLGGAVRRLGDLSQARSLLTEGLALAYRIGNRHILTFYLFHLAMLAVSDGDLERAAYLLSASVREQQEIGSSFNSPENEEYEATLRRLRSELGAEGFERASAAGAGDSLRSVVGRALGED